MTTRNNRGSVRTTANVAKAAANVLGTAARMYMNAKKNTPSAPKERNEQREERASKQKSNKNSSYSESSAPVAFGSQVYNRAPTISSAQNRLRIRGHNLLGFVTPNVNNTDLRCCIEVFGASNTTTLPSLTFTLELLTMGYLPYFFGEIFARWRVISATVHYVPSVPTSQPGSLTFGYGRDVSSWNALRDSARTSEFSTQNPRNNQIIKDMVVSSYDGAISTPVYLPTSSRIISKPTELLYCNNNVSGTNGPFVSLATTPAYYGSGQVQENMFAAGVVAVSLTGETNEAIPDEYGKVYLEYDIEFSGLDFVSRYLTSGSLPTSPIPNLHDLFQARVDYALNHRQLIDCHRESDEAADELTDLVHVPHNSPYFGSNSRSMSSRSVKLTNDDNITVTHSGTKR